jgi:hypothetical protein
MQSPEIASTESAVEFTLKMAADAGKTSNSAAKSAKQNAGRRCRAAERNEHELSMSEPFD